MNLHLAYAKRTFFNIICTWPTRNICLMHVASAHPGSTVCRFEAMLLQFFTTVVLALEFWAASWPWAGAGCGRHNMRLGILGCLPAVGWRGVWAVAAIVCRFEFWAVCYSRSTSGPCPGRGGTGCGRHNMCIGILGRVTAVGCRGLWLL